MDSFLVGPFQIKFVWLFLLAGLFFAYITIDEWLKRDIANKRNLFYGILSTCIMIVMITYKFSFLLFRPAILWENPMGILFFTGSKSGIIIGIIFAIFYLMRQFHLHQMNEWRYWKLIVYGSVTFVASYYVVQMVFSLLI